MGVEGQGLEKIRIEDLRLSCIIGINEDERIRKQEININVVLYADLKKACKSDNIEDTIDYKKLKQSIIATVKDSSYFLIERLAGHIAEICLGHPLVQKVKVKVDKPYALSYARTVSIEIVRKKKEREGRKHLSVWDPISIRKKISLRPFRFL
jgi:D-erythro-7,8-dihydroneopterin triphosphate epimerase